MKKIETIQSWDLPAGYTNTGISKQRIEPHLHPENLRVMVEKINELVNRANLVNEILSDHDLN